MEGTARGLAATGPEQSAFLGQVGRAYRTNPMADLLINGGAATTNLAARDQTKKMANYLLGR